MTVQTLTMKEAQEERLRLAGEIRELADREESWVADDHERWQTINNEYDAVVGHIDGLNHKREVAERRALTEEDDTRLQAPARGFRGSYGYSPRLGPTPEERAKCFQSWFLHANDLNVSEDMQRSAADCGFNYRANGFEVKIDTRSPMQGYEMFCCQQGRINWAMFEQKRDKKISLEQRQMQTGMPGEGAEFVPELFQYELERAMLAYGGFRRIARIFPTAGGNPLKWPTVDDTANLATIVGENADVGSHTAPTTGDIDFTAYKYSSSPVLVTAELLEDSAFNMAALLGSLLGERLGRGQAVHLANGNGTTQPQGILEGATTGHTAAAATLAADDLIDLQGSLDPAYESLPSVGWAFSKSTLTAIRKLKLTDDQYIWQPGLRAAEPDLLLGAPYSIIQEMPAIGSSTEPIIYGAFEKFIIREVASIRFYRLEELYRANDNTGFLALHRMDSRVIQPAALKKLVMGL